jgi:hypothetical protein
MTAPWRRTIAAVLLGAAASLLAAEGEPSGRVPGAAPAPAPVTPPSAEQIERAIARGLDFILARQNRDGSWGSPRRTKGLNIYAPAPGAHDAFRAAVTGLCIATLVETGGGRDGVRAALDRAGDWMLRNLPRLRRATPDALYNVWGHAYSIQGLVRLARRPDTPPGRRRAFEDLIRSQIELLERYESVDGGWGYYDFRVGARKPTSSPTSFTTATALVAFHEARELGIEVPERLVRRAIAAVRRQQKPDLSYLYDEDSKWTPMWEINRPGGSLGRSQACNIALRLWGDATVTDEALRTWLDRLFARNLWLDIGRKRPVPHESWFLVAGYFYYYGHYYAALCIEALPAGERPRLRAHLARLLLEKQERDGSWWDYPFYDYHQDYGTAFAVLALGGCLGEDRPGGRAR